MSQWPLFMAAALSAAWFIVHTFVGGPQVIGPLRQSTDLPKLVIAILWMVWHMVTLVILVMAVAFLLAAMWQSRGLALAGTALSAALCLAGVVIIPAAGLRYTEAPQGWLFLPGALLGLYALL